MGKVIAAWRRHPAHGGDRVSQLRLADVAGVSQGQLSKVEAGGHELNNRLDLLRLWAKLLGMPSRLSWFGPIDDHSGTESSDGAPLDSVGDVNRREFGAGLLAASGLLALSPHATRALSATSPARIGRADVHRLARTMAQRRSMDARLGGDALVDLAVLQHERGRQWLSQSRYTDSVGQQIQAVLAEDAANTGWLAFDAGRWDVARDYYAEALSRARVADAPHAEVYALNHAAGLANHLGPDREAAQQAEAGQRIARRLGSHRLIALLAVREARSYAVLGDVERFQRALSRAHREFEIGDDRRDNDPTWISFFDPAELLGLEGTCWADLGQYQRAVPLLEQALSRQAPTFQRNRALYQGRLAVARLGNGDPAHAVANATVTLQLLESGVTSARTAELVRTVRQQVRPYRQEPAVREFVARYDQYVAA
jgi:transcriptional regulator with XRE-family HTH domain